MSIATLNGHTVVAQCPPAYQALARALTADEFGTEAIFVPFITAYVPLLRAAGFRGQVLSSRQRQANDGKRSSACRTQSSATRHTERELELAMGLTTACAGWRELVEHVEKMTGQHLSTTRSAITALLALAQGREQPVLCAKGIPS